MNTSSEEDPSLEKAGDVQKKITKHSNAYQTFGNRFVSFSLCVGSMLRKQ